MRWTIPKCEPWSQPLFIRRLSVRSPDGALNSGQVSHVVTAAASTAGASMAAAVGTRDRTRSALPARRHPGDQSSRNHREESPDPAELSQRKVGPPQEGHPTKEQRTVDKDATGDDG